MHATQSVHLDDPAGDLGRHAFRDVTTYVAACIGLGLAILVRYSLSPWIGAVLSFVTVPGAVAAAACLGGYRPAVLVAVLGYALSAWFLVPDHGVPTDAIELGGWLAERHSWGFAFTFRPSNNILLALYWATAPSISRKACLASSSENSPLASTLRSPD